MLNRYATGLTLRRRAEVAALYHRAFPPSERVPLPLLCLASLRRGVDLEVYEEGSALAGDCASAGSGPSAGGGRDARAKGGASWEGAGCHGPGRGSCSGLVGFTYTVQTPEVFFLLFLAVDDAHQGRGYGSQILGDVLERAGRRPVVLEIEPLDPSASNIDQRYRRLAFYRRHGLELTGYDVLEGGERYTVLSSTLPLHVPALGRALRRLVPSPLGLPGLERTRFWPERDTWPQAACPAAWPAGSVSARGSVEAAGAESTADSAGAAASAGAVERPRP
ncbi:GNAT family N-acetyltransferase [Actinomyces wuliandei]|uniref:GNAT family N-acetyltransferase n=1 Tax=Actinomyces wuliandei TaxID=2057743 RepID=UPI000FD7B781|nr:GNAT family N-acetyltransferase [Actinomyces wuliandei]